MNYLFTSERLGFRNWEEHDLTDFTAMNADPEVMAHFPAPLTAEESRKLFDRLRAHFVERGYCYFATEVLNTGEWIGFTGLAYQEFPSSFTPCTDIGWRLKRSAWGSGYATEGAQRCLIHAFEQLGIERIISTCTRNNRKSEHVMQKIGMTRMGTFTHPYLETYPALQPCIWYEIHKPDA